MNRALAAIGLIIKSAFSTETRQERFRRYALTNRWRNRETASGPGSTIEYTENLRAELPRLLEKFQIRTMLDAPCGDYNWMQLVERPGVQYIGGEIVPEFVEANNARYADDNTRFILCDILQDDLPPVDLWVCRDVFFHFPYADIFQTLSNLFRSEITYILSTDHPEQGENTDIRIGVFRPLNMMREPFCFPEPILWIDDWIDGYPVRRMGLWDVKSLQAAVVGNAVYQRAIS
jgi:SAM-dependent methyltransferase